MRYIKEQKPPLMLFERAFLKRDKHKVKFCLELHCDNLFNKDCKVLLHSTDTLKSLLSVVVICSERCFFFVAILSSTSHYGGSANTSRSFSDVPHCQISKTETMWWLVIGTLTAHVMPNLVIHATPSACAKLSRAEPRHSLPGAWQTKTLELRPSCPLRAKHVLRENTQESPFSAG